MNDLRESNVRNAWVTAWLGLCLFVVTISLNNRVVYLERQVDTLGKAVKVAHGEAKEAQRTQRNPYYLPDPMKVVKK